MALKGDLASVDLAQVFQMLSLNQKVGILGIEAVRASRALHFDSRGVTIFFDEPLTHERVVMQAQRRGYVDDAALQDARAHSKRSGKSLIESLLAGGYFSDGQLADMTRAELEEDIYDIFFWRHAQFEFYEHADRLPTGADHKDDRFYFSVDSVIMEAARRIDEWAFIQQRVKSGFEVFRVRNVDPSTLEDIDELVFGLADGMRNVARLIELTGLPRFQVFKSLAVLHEGGYVERVPDDELWGYARAAHAEERPYDAIDVYEKAIESGADCSAIRVEVATVYESVEEFARAGAHLERVAAAHIEAGELRPAIVHLQHVVQMLPTNLGAREQLVTLTVGHPEIDSDGFDASAHGKQLVDLYMEIGEIERVRGILEQLLRAAPTDLALKKRLINVHTKAGDTRRVVELYESIADDLVREREPIEAIKYLQKIVMIDRSRRDVSERIRSLYEADERRRSRRRSLVALGGLMLIVAGIAAGWYVYERYAREQMVTLETAINQLAQDGKFDAAIAKLAEFTTRFPLTIVAREADSETARIESLRDAHEEQARIRERQLELERQGMRAEYRRAWIEYEQSFRAGALDAALAAIKRVQQLVIDSGAAEDLQWAQQVSLNANRFSLEEYISESARLDREAWADLEAGRWQAARSKWLRLVSDFDASALASTVRLPVQIASRPAGAELWVDGQRFGSSDDAAPRVTPTVVLCKPDTIERFELRLDGFATTALEIDASATEAVEPTLQVVPKRVFAFGEGVRAPVSVSRGTMAVGLRNGRVAFADVETGQVKVERQLDGLDEVRGRAVFAADRCFYLTTAGFLESRRLPLGELVWRERLASDPLHDPILHANGLVIVDNQGALSVYDSSTGVLRWQVALEGNAVGAPMLDGSQVYLGTREGEIVVVDLSTRRVTSRSPRLDAGVATDLRNDRGGFLYGDDHGRLVSRRRVSGGEAWRVDLNRSLAPEDFVLADDVVFARHGRSKIVKLRVSDGQETAAVELDRPIVAGPFVNDRHVFVVVRRRGDDGAAVDVLRAFDRAALNLAWEFEDGDRFVATATCDAYSLYLPDSKGNVLRFR